MSNGNGLVTRISKEQYEATKRLQKILIAMHKDNVSYMKASRIGAKLLNRSLNNDNIDLIIKKANKRGKNDIF